MPKKSCVLVWCWLLTMISVGWAAERPTSEPKNCVTEECHGEYKTRKYVHGPVGLGDCESCHRAVDYTEHTFEITRRGKSFVRSVTWIRSRKRMCTSR